MVVLVYPKAANFPTEQHASSSAEASAEAPPSGEAPLEADISVPTSATTAAASPNTEAFGLALQRDASDDVGSVQLYEGTVVSTSIDLSAKKEVAERAVDDSPRDSSKRRASGNSRASPTSIGSDAEGASAERVIDDSRREPSKTSALVRQAEAGAEKQAQARETMLTLKDAFQSALDMQADMERQRQRDKEKMADLMAQHRADQRRLGDLLEQLKMGATQKQIMEARRRIAELQAELEESRQREENHKIAKWTDRLKNHKGHFNLVMALARDAHPLGALSSNSLARPDDADVEESLQGSIGRSQTDSVSGSRKKSDRAHCYDPRGSSAADWKSQGSAPDCRRQSNQDATETTTSSMPHSQDNSADQLHTSSGQEGEVNLELAKSDITQQQLSAAQQKVVEEETVEEDTEEQKVSPSSRDGSAVLGSATSLARYSGVAAALGSTTSMARNIDNEDVADEEDASTTNLGIVAVNIPGRTTGDNLFLSWVLKLWSHAIHANGYVRNYDKGIQTDAVAQVQTDGNLQDQLMDLKYDLKQSEMQRLQAEQERDAMAAQLAQANAEKEQLANEMARMKKEHLLQLSEKDKELQLLQQKYLSQQEDMQRLQAAWENEKRQLNAKIREINSELQQAIIQARRAMLLAQGKKKDAAMEDRLAQLIKDLEATKNKLASVSKERDQARTENDSLNRRLGQNQRKMELERQFLPLLHLAKGPIGERTVQQSKTWSSKSEPRLPTIAQPEMLQ